jgi:hypothetical protein
MSEKDVKPSLLYNEVNGYRFFPNFMESEEITNILENNSNIKIDLFLASYPKCGTNWLKHIVYQIINGINSIDVAIPYPYYECKIYTQSGN